MGSIEEYKSKKILFLMLDFDGDPWTTLYKDGCEQTWVKDSQFQVLRYRGKSQIGMFKKILNRFQISHFGLALWSKSRIAHQLSIRNLNSVCEVNSVLNVNAPDNWWRHGQKFLSALKYCVDNIEFDYLVRGNATLYVNEKKLMEFLCSKDPLYAGPIEKEKEFVSGWGIVLNRDTCKLILSLNFELFSQYFDDEAIGRTLNKFGIKATKMPFLWVQKSDDLEKNTLSDYVFIRTKSYDQNGARNDATLMARVHAKFKNC